MPGNWLHTLYVKYEDSLFSANYRDFLGFGKRRKIDTTIRTTAESSASDLRACNNGIQFKKTLILLAIYFLLITFALDVVARAKERFGALLVFGMLSIFFWQIGINIAMVGGLLPVAGIPLPLFSYGGSSLVSMMTAMGIIMNVSMRRFTF